MTVQAVPSPALTRRHEPHITDRDVCARCRQRQCVDVCPTRCYRRREDHRVELDVTACVECRACVLICYEFTNIEWRLRVEGS